MHTLTSLLSLWLIANLLHAAWVCLRRYGWERSIVRDADGLLPDAREFTTGKGPVALLLIHGFADTPRIWKRLADRLADSGTFTCRAMRLPGCAQPSALAKGQSLAQWRDAVDREIDRLHTAHRNVWVLGHSMGAALALDAALRRPDAVGGVAAFAPLIDVSRSRSPVLPAAVWFKLATVALALSPTFESCFSATGVAVDDPAFTYTRDRFIPFCVYRGLFKLIRSNRHRANRIACPVFAAASERDSVVDTPAALRWLSVCPGVKRIKTYADIGHVIPLENGWQALTDGLAAFIREQTA